ncbi:thioesterase family protein [Mycolicibacterium pyrenivorans]|uniref:thioesterase family protein n=1 Tax=Mycolicibacterium pyrenivorans TaxID=187102 RepID=UPI0021F2ACB4|nr:thioesterase family protein [Mycolicibacterium pyrenivorans]MCV7151372.1 thioesterase family protein [Mycolicibacterium pyrenivorans]
MELGACFAREGGGFVPGSTARGGWGESVSGHAVGGLLAWALERVVGDTDMQPARLTVDLPKPMALEPVELHTEILRDGRRLRLIEASLAQRGAIVAKASGLFLRRCEQPGGDVWSPQVVMPPLPSEDDVAAAALFIRTYGWGAPMQNPDQDWSGEAGRKYTWLNMTQPAVDGEELTPFVRAAMAGDITASLANWGTAGLKFINADYTVTLSRLPQGPVLGLAAEAHHSFDGVATGSATLVDTEGPVGTCVAVALAHSGFRVPQG